MTATKRTQESPTPSWITGEEDGKNRRPRIKAPFVLTCMGDDGGPVYWLWSRRERQWVVEQEVVVDACCCVPNGP